MNIFKDSYKIVRENSDEIYKGFGFRHLSDATQYYVHPKNESYRGTTTLCQPIGEGITLFSLVLKGLVTEEEGINGDKITIKTLRYYEKEGLLKPIYIDQDTKYRYYENSQLVDISKIISLRQLGLYIKDIK